jgi:hypothetical protein
MLGHSVAKEYAPETRSHRDHLEPFVLQSYLQQLADSIVVVG